jgi:hypothetical protein
MDLRDTIDNLENFGIDLKLDSKKAEAFYCETIKQWFEQAKGYVTTTITDCEFSLMEDHESNEIAIIYIFESVLRIKPIEDAPYEVLLDVLEFIAEHHKQTLEVFNYLEGNGDIKEAQVKRVKKKIEPEEDSSSEEDSEDSEWI